MNALDFYERELDRAIAAGFAHQAKRIANDAAKGIGEIEIKAEDGSVKGTIPTITPEAQMKLRAAETAVELARAFAPHREARG